MKKFLSVSLAAMMLASVAGCGNTEKKEEVKEDAKNEVVASDYAEIKEKGKMTIGITIFAPMNYYDPNNELIGFDTELAKAVGEKIDLDVDFQVINWDSKEIELNSKNVDCLWNGFSITEERKKNMAMTDPYLKNSQAMVMKPENAEKYGKDPSGAAIVAEQGSTGEAQINGTTSLDASAKINAKEFFSKCNYTAVDSMAKAIMEVYSGTADIALVDTVCAYGMVGEGTDYPDLVVNTDNDFGGQEEYGIAFRKDSDMPEKVNTALKELMEDGTFKKIADKYKLTEMMIK